MVQNGMAVYKGIFNSSNIDSTGYAFLTYVALE